MQVTTVGIDLAKNVFQIHGIAENGAVVFNRAIRRAQLLAFFEGLPPCRVGMEACGSSHHWARQISALGHDVRLIPANYVKPHPFALGRFRRWGQIKRWEIPGLVFICFFCFARRVWHHGETTYDSECDL